MIYVESGVLMMYDMGIVVVKSDMVVVSLCVWN